MRERKNDNVVVGGVSEEIKEAHNEDDYLQVNDYEEEKETLLQQFLFQQFRGESKRKSN
jgi:hypothetical protein